MMTSQQPSSDALPAKQRPGRDADHRHEPAQLGEARRTSARCRESPLVSVSPGRPPPPSANSTSGMRPRLRDVDHAIGLAVVLRALRAGEHGVVVGHHDAARLRLAGTGRR